MKKIVLMILLAVVLGACAFHAKQPKDDTYYKKTQTIGWPDE